MSANPNPVSVEVGKTANVSVSFFNIDHQALSTATWLPLSSVASSNTNIATVTVVNNELRITGQGVGTATVTVTSSASVKTTITVQVTEPTPVITVTNTFAVTKGGVYELFVTGTGILPDAKVQVNGQVFTPTVMPDGRLRVFLDRDATYAMNPVPLQVGVFNPPNGALSNLVNVEVRYPVPDVEQLSVTSAPQGSPDVTVDIQFEASFAWAAYPVTKARFNGTDLATTRLNNYTVRAVIPAALLTTAGTYDIDAVNPGTFDGISKPFTVTAPAGTVKFDFSNYEPQVLLAAMAQGTNPFVAVPLVNKEATFPLSGSAPAQFAFVSAVGSNFRSLVGRPETAGVITYLVTVLQMSAAELTAGTIPMGLPFGTTALSGTVTGIGAGQIALLQWGNAATGATQAQPGFSMTNASAGSHGLVGYLKGTTSISAGDRIFRRSNQAAGSGITIDFNGAESAPVATATASLTGLIAGDQAFGQMGYTTEATCEGNFLYTTPASASFLITGFPGAVQGTNDRHLFTFLILNGSSVLSHTINSKALGAFSATRPPPLAAPTVSDVPGAPYQIKQAQVNLGNYNTATLFYSTMAVTATRNFFGGATGLIKAPDLSGVAGWSTAYAPPTTNAWTVGAMTTVYPLPGCADGSTRTVTSVAGTNP